MDLLSIKPTSLIFVLIYFLVLVLVFVNENHTETHNLSVTIPVLPIRPLLYLWLMPAVGTVGKAT